jgi:hypothetical protein
MQAQFSYVHYFTMHGSINILRKIEPQQSKDKNSMRDYFLEFRLILG